MLMFGFFLLVKGRDYRPLSTEVTFLPTDLRTPKCIFVGILDDVILESNEEFTVNIDTDFSSILIAPTRQSRITIVSNDGE